MLAFDGSEITDEDLRMENALKLPLALLATLSALGFLPCRPDPASYAEKASVVLPDGQSPASNDA
jgi:hypothetical protein